MLEIPIDPVTDQEENEITLTCALESNRYILKLSWSPLVGRWYLDLSSTGPDEIVSIISGAPLLMGYPLLAGNPSPNRPPGELVLFPRIDSLEDYTKEMLGAQVYLKYYTAAEMGR